MSVQGFKQVYKPEHPNANKYGFVAEQTIAAEEKLGRYLKKTEVVCHIDKNNNNNDPDNLIIFRNKNSYDRYRLGGKPVQNDDGSYSTPREIQNRVCELCGRVYAPKSSTQKFCSKACAELALIQENMPSKRELKSHLMTMSFSQIGSLYDVSNKVVKSWCRTYNLPATATSVQKMRELVKMKESQRIIHELQQNNRKLSEQLQVLNGEADEDGGDDSWLE